MINKSKNENCKADLVLSAVEKFAQVIPLNLQEIFIWYFEQKGVDNPERFLGGVNGVNEGVNEEVNEGVNEGVNKGAGVNDNSVLGLLASNTEAGVNKNEHVSELQTPEPNEFTEIQQIQPQENDESNQIILNKQTETNTISSDLIMRLLSILIPLFNEKKDTKLSDFGEFIQQIEQLLTNKEIKNEI